MHLRTLGWNDTWKATSQPFFQQDFIIGRIAAGFGQLWTVLCEQGSIRALWRGGKAETALQPAVGDWVIARPLLDEAFSLDILQVLPRQSAMVRKKPGKATQDQVLAANMDAVFIVSSLNREFNAARLERYLVMAWQSGAQPVLVLTKADLCEDPTPFLDVLEEVAIGVPYHLTSANTGLGLEALHTYLQPNRSVILVGSSGVGKSTLVNALYGHQHQETGAIRDDDEKGRHTTTHRQLLCLPRGGVIVDSPGLRELQVWDDGEGLAQTYADIESFAQACYFRDCGHDSEPGCAVLEAVGRGELANRRLENYRKLQREMAHLASQISTSAAQKRKRHDKLLAKAIRDVHQKKYGK